MLDAVAGAVRVERGEGVAVEETGKVALVAQFSVGAKISLSLLELVRQLAENGYRSIVCSTCEVSEPLEWPGALPDGTVVLRRPNVGYDFGSWALALDRFPQVAGVERVILTNDSMAGPFAPIAPLLAHFERNPVDVWALTDSYQLGRHLQSFFVGFRDGVLAEAPLRDFFARVRIEPEKMEVVRRYELGLTQTCQRGAYSMTAMYRSQELGIHGENPTLAGWQRLLAAGFPFVKRTLVNDPSTAPGATDAVRVVRERFGVELSEWL